MVVVKVIAKLTDADGNVLVGKPIDFYRSYDGVTWELLDTVPTNTNGISEITDTVDKYGTVYYKAVFPGDEIYSSSEAVGYFTNVPDYSGLVVLCFMMETIKGLTREASPDYGKCINILVINELIKRLYS